MKRPLITFALAVLLCAGMAGSVRADERLTAARSAVSEWVEVERAISREAVAWREKKNLLADLAAVARARIETSKESLSEAEKAAGVVEERRAGLVAERESNERLIAKIAEFLEEMETKLRVQVKRLPAPLREKLISSMQRLPADPRKTELGVGARMQTVMGILTEIQRFDTLITIGEELRESESGVARQARTIHFGLGAAYFVYVDGSDAGIGRSTENGWSWESRPELAAAVNEAIATAEGGKREARFVALPVTVEREER